MHALPSIPRALPGDRYSSSRGPSTLACAAPPCSQNFVEGATPTHPCTHKFDPGASMGTRQGLRRPGRFDGHEAGPTSTRALRWARGRAHVDPGASMGTKRRHRIRGQALAGLTFWATPARCARPPRRPGAPRRGPAFPLRSPVSPRPAGARARHPQRRPPRPSRLPAHRPRCRPNPHRPRAPATNCPSPRRPIKSASGGRMCAARRGRARPRPRRHLRLMARARPRSPRCPRTRHARFASPASARTRHAPRARLTRRFAVILNSSCNPVVKTPGASPAPKARGALAFALGP